MICPTCGSTTYKMTTVILDDKPFNFCMNCPVKPEIRPRFKTDGVRVQGACGGRGYRTQAHNDDISRRRRAPDGSIYRDYGRRYI